MEPILNFQVPVEGLELVILLHTQYFALRHYKSKMNYVSHPKFFLAIIMHKKVMGHQSYGLCM